MANVRTEYDEVRRAHAGRIRRTRTLTFAQARDRRFAIEWNGFQPATPKQPGIQTLTDYSIEELRTYIDWSPFFTAWELKGKFPAIFDDPVVGDEARSVYEDAQRLLDRIIAENLLTAEGVFGLFPANTVNVDDVAIYGDESRVETLATFRHLRQQMEKPPGRPNVSLADFVLPFERGPIDYVGAFAVTAGVGASELAAAFEADHDDYSSILVKAIADRLAEAFAERLHQRVRSEFWGYAPDEELTGTDLVRERYRGIRPAPGYPACPDHSQKFALFDLLGVTNHTSISLTESGAMLPAASVSGWYFAHPDAYYFGLGNIGRDQVEAYASSKGIEIEQAERWLGPNLSYDPEEAAG